MAAEVVMELAVAVVVEVEVAVMGGVPFGHPRPPKMSTIIWITLSDKVILLKKSIIIVIYRISRGIRNAGALETLTKIAKNLR
jgi:hypothetical protein